MRFLLHDISRIMKMIDIKRKHYGRGENDEGIKGTFREIRFIDKLH